MINNKDKLILKTIVENARLPISTIAKKTRMSREVVQYHLNNLEKGLIIRYSARINMKAFSSEIYTLFLNINGLSEKEILSKLKTLPNIHWIGHSGGRWNYIITFSANNNLTQRQFIDSMFEVLNKENKNVSIKVSYTCHLKEYKDTYAGLFGVKDRYISEKEIPNMKNIGELDSSILSELANNARVSNEIIAQKYHTNRETIRQHIKSLEERKIILNYRTIIRPSFLGLETFFLNIKCKVLNHKALQPLCEHLSLIDGSIYVCTTSGDINIISQIYTKSLHELNNICSELRERFPEIIEELEPIPLFDAEEHTYAMN